MIELIKIKRFTKKIKPHTEKNRFHETSDGLTVFGTNVNTRWHNSNFYRKKTIVKQMVTRICRK